MLFKSKWNSGGVSAPVREAVKAERLNSQSLMEDILETSENANPDDKAGEAAAAAASAAASAAAVSTKTAAELQAELESERAARTESERVANERAARLTALEKAEEERKAAGLSEAEREKKRAEDAEKSAQGKDATIRRLAILQGVRDVAPAIKVDLDLDAVKDLYAAGAFDSIKVDANGDPQGLDAALRDLVKRKPYLVKAKAEAPDINATKGGAADNSGEMTDARKAELKSRYRLR